MIKDNRLDRDYILQSDIIDGLIPSIGVDDWQPLYISRYDSPDNFGLFCSLIEEDHVADCLKSDSWDLHIGDGRPGFSQSFTGNRKKTKYHRYGGTTGIRPLVVSRHFHSAFPAHSELCEEFRHYHDLAHDSRRDLLLDFDSSGYEIIVVEIRPNLVKARLRYLRQFQAGTRLHLGIYIDSVRYSNVPLDQIPPERFDTVYRSELAHYTRYITACDNIEKFATCSRVIGKVLLAPPKLSRAGIWPFSISDRDKEQEIFFIFGTDKEGQPVEYTSEPSKLANYFGANPNAPHYLTPIFFRKEVLSKYYADPDRYAISDGYLSCRSLWGCQIDNNHSTHVVVFLGDLGRDLPLPERFHWKQFNVPPEGEVSETNFRRSFLAQWAGPSAPDLVFRREYRHLNEHWENAQGWPLFLPPGRGDEHLIETIRVPINNSQAELDTQVLNLSKLLVDSLNEKEIEKRAGKGEPDEKGITKFERFLKQTKFSGVISVVELFRNIQTLRSTGSGHRKGSDYEKILARLGADARDKPTLFKALLEQTVATLATLGHHYCPDYKPVRPTKQPE